VTGTLHVGHAVMLAIEDMMVRYHRMKGDRTVWIPGLDHAAIATQNVVEKQLWQERRKTRHDLGREVFLKEVEAFVEQSKARIITQTKAMGASLDWSRLAYTLDEQRSRAVREMFVRMYEAGILYRGNRIVNWCPRCKSTLADDEVEYREERTPFYYFTYGPVVIGTARPETKFQDKTLVVHPSDERYKDLVGKTFPVEWIEDQPLTSNVIADPVIDPTFGTGAMTITPAHSFEDFDLATRHGLPIVTIIDEDGKLTAAAGSFAGRNAREARADIVAVLQKKGLVDHVDEHYVHNLSVCYRCETPVEPLPKLQWFVAVSKPFRPRTDGHGSVRIATDARMVSLKDLAIEAVAFGEITILPERFTKEYFHWMENLRDWCISRQIWFGHRLPVWYRGEEIYVGVAAPIGDDWTQDPDTLDTWFSSGMWTFSTLGWPKVTKELKNPEADASRRYGAGARTDERNDLAAFHPTSVLETGYDILFFWIARMILMTEFALGEVPFKTVYLHGLVRDAKGRKMSKSLGNVIDPLDMIQKYGADAVRLALFIGTAPGMDTKLDEQKIAGYAKFVTKIWNIGRYVLTKSTVDSRQSTAAKGDRPNDYRLTTNDLGVADHWILSRRDQLVRDVTAAYEAHEYSKAAQMTYDFAWHEFADWYIEATKVASAPSSKLQAASSRILVETLEIILKLLHPAMPYVTERLWQAVRSGEWRVESGELLIVQSWPQPTDGQTLGVKCQVFEFTRELITAIRQIRNTEKIQPKQLIDVTLVPGNDEERAWCADAEAQALLKHFVRAREVRTGERLTMASNNGTLVRSTTVYVTPIS
jgi:valyl-tRNA synthetase